MNIHVYGCGSPIRIPTMQDVADGITGSRFFVEPNPVFRGSTSVVWGLIRGAKEIMKSCQNLGFPFYQVDNAYFGREEYYRISKNDIQLNRSLPFTAGERLYAMQRRMKFNIHDWQERRGSRILICLSTPMLFEYHGIDRSRWLENVITELRRHTDRPIFVREKQVSGIDAEILDSWIVVTHSSAASLDALRLGVPVVTTGRCPAKGLSTDIAHVETPNLTGDRYKLFCDLSWHQYTREEFKSGFAWKLFSDIYGDGHFGANGVSYEEGA